MSSKIRRIEVITGLLIIMTAFSFVAALLLDFDFVSPYATLKEDLSYLSDHLRSQQISSWAWLTTSITILIATPFYFVMFHKRLRYLHYITGLMMLGGAAGFLLMGLTGLDLHQDLVRITQEGFEQADGQAKLGLLQQYRQAQLYRYAGSSFVGLFAMGLGLIKFRLAKFPIFSTILLLSSGPVLIFFNWYDPDHLARTVAMAGIMIGVTVFCVRLINKGI